MERSGKENEGFSKAVLLEMISDFREVLNRAEAKLSLHGSNVESSDIAVVASEGVVIREKGKGKVSDEKQEVEKTRLVHCSPASVDNDRSTGEPYTQSNPTDPISSTSLDDGAGEASPPSDNIMPTGAGADANEDIRVSQKAELNRHTTPPLRPPEGWRELLKWFEAVDEESEKAESSQTRWAKFWRRLKDQVFNEQAAPPDGWAKLWKRLRAADEEKVRDYKEDIDSLLILAGLFSAIVTAFLIAFYVALQPDSKDTTAFLVYQISLQLSTAFPISGQSFDATQLSVPSFPFQIPASTVRINAVWFASLICALTTASFGILVKQWLREYMAIADMKPDRQCRVRYLREVNLYRWGVHHIASFLPLLLQGAIILFFVGLLDLARLLHPTIGGIVIAFVAAYLLFFVGTTLAPMVDPHCPYRTPFLNTALQIPRYLWYKVQRYLHRYILYSTFWHSLSFRTRLLDVVVPERYVEELERFHARGFDAFQLETGENRRLDIPCMISAGAVLHDQDLKDSYQLCLGDLHWKEAMESGPFPPRHTAVRSLLKQEDLRLFWQTSLTIIEYPALLAISQFLGTMVLANDSNGEEKCSEVYSHLRSALASYRVHLGDRRIFKETVAPKLKDSIHLDSSYALGVIRVLQKFFFHPLFGSLEWCNSSEDIDALMGALCSFGNIKDLSDLVDYGLRLVAVAARTVPAADQRELKRVIPLKLSYLVSDSIRTSECSFGVIQAINELTNAGMEDTLLDWCSSPQIISGLLNALGSPAPLEVPKYFNRFDWSLIIKFLTTATESLSTTERQELQPYFLRARPRIERSIEIWRNLGGTDGNYKTTLLQYDLDNLQKAVFQSTGPSSLSEKIIPPTLLRQEIAQSLTIDYQVSE